MAAVLLLSIFTPWAVAEDAPARRTAAKPRSKIQKVSAEEERPSDQAVQRWGQLKSRYRATDDGESTPRRTASTASRPTRRAAPVRPIPDDVPEELSTDDERIEDAGWLDEDFLAEPRAKVRPFKVAPTPSADEPLPVTDVDDEPAWIYGTTADSVETTEDDAVALQGDAGSESASEPAPPAGAVADDAPVGETGDDPAYAPRPGSRRPRQIRDILPTYDLTYDQDIRDFARQQAKQYNVEFGGGPFPQRMFPGLIYQWEPSNFYHYPLYFEDAALERYGHTYSPCIQPMVSIAKFGGQFIFLPYQMTLDPACCPKYVLGWYRPGECAPKLHYQPPLNAKAAAVEAGVITGLFFAIP